MFESLNHFTNHFTGYEISKDKLKIVLNIRPDSEYQPKTN